MFAQTRFSVGVGFGGNGGGFYQQPPSYAYVPPCPGPGYSWVDGYWSQDYGRNTWVNGYWNAPPLSSDYGRYYDRDRFDNRFRGGDDRQRFARGSEQDRNRGSFDQGRNFSGQDRNQNRGFNQVQSRDFGRNQNENQNRNQNGGNRNR
ncbi:MAG: putative signal peptide protein [Bryobacterales bacterium]|nr:putative signal peptide protein [Bryobacterales bacterium]